VDDQSVTFQVEHSGRMLGEGIMVSYWRVDPRIVGELEDGPGRGRVIRRRQTSTMGGAGMARVFHVLNRIVSRTRMLQIAEHERYKKPN
jgi:hypothetical protein